MKDKNQGKTKVQDDWKDQKQYYKEKDCNGKVQTYGLKQVW